MESSLNPSSFYFTVILSASILYWHAHSYLKKHEFTKGNFHLFLYSRWKSYLFFTTVFFLTFYISNISVANLLLSFLIIIYINDKSIYSNISPLYVILIPVLVMVYLILPSLEQTVGIVGPRILSPILAAPLAFLAAVFAYFSWQEVAIDERHSVEEALNNRYKNRTFPDFSGHQIVQQAAKLEIEMIEVWETASKLKRIIKYLPAKHFTGTTTLRIKFLTSEDPVKLSDLWDILNEDLNVLDISQYEKNKFSIMIRSTTIESVDSFIQKGLTERIPGLNDQYITMHNPDSGQTSQFVLRGASETTPLFHNNSDLEIGAKIIGNIQYNPVKRASYLPFIRDELRELRKIKESDNVSMWVYPDTPRLSPAPVVIRGKADNKTFPKRYFSGLLEEGVPEQFKSLPPEARPERYRSAIQGLELVRRRFVDTTIVGICKKEHQSGNEYKCLNISINPSIGDSLNESAKIDGICHYIPIDNFTPHKFGCDVEIDELTFEKYGENINEIMTSNLTAEYVFAREYNIGAIYTYQNLYVVFYWRTNGEKRLVMISEKLTEVLTPSIIWARDL